ncbi:hypothetical protein D3C86_1385610 [compost metagenome]
MPLLAPVLAPGIADEESLLGVVVTDHRHGMAADDRLVAPGQGHLTRLGHGLGHERVVEGDAEDDGVVARERRLHALDGRDPAHLELLVSLGLVVLGLARVIGEARLAVHVGGRRLGGRADLHGDPGGHVHERARITLGRLGHAAGVLHLLAGGVIEEERRKGAGLGSLAPLDRDRRLHGAGGGERGARAQGPLVAHRREVGAKVHLGGQGLALDLEELDPHLALETREIRGLVLVGQQAQGDGPDLGLDGARLAQRAVGLQGVGAVLRETHAGRQGAPRQEQRESDQGNEGLGAGDHGNISCSEITPS